MTDELKEAVVADPHIYSDLLPCPFCGYKASMTQVESAAGGTRMTWIVGCHNEDCGVSFHGHATRRQARSDWNRRLK